MIKHIRPVLFAAAVALVASPASAGELKLSIEGGRVTLIAQDVQLRQILAEWARIGRTTIVNGEKLAGPALTLQLVDVPEQQVLDILLRSASGYVAARRPAAEPGASMFDRVMILPTSRPPVQSATAPPPAYNRQMMAQPMPAPDDDDEPMDTPVMPPGAAQPQLGPNGQPMFQPQTTPGMPQPTAPGMQQYQPYQQQPNPAQQPVVTAPRPGMLPAPPPPQPYVPGGGRGAPPTRPGGPGGGPGGEG